MLVILFFGLIATCTAVQPNTVHQSFNDRPFVYHSYYNPNGPVIYDFNDGFETHVGHGMNKFGTVFSQTSPGVSSTEGIQGNQYKITMPLSGYLKKDIVVKTSPGLVTVKAMRAMPQGSYIDITKQLPPYVNFAGLWNYENGVLNIVFPLNPVKQVQSAGSSNVPQPGQASVAPVTKGGAPAAVHSVVQDSVRQ